MSDSQSTIERFYNAFNANDMDTAAAQFADDVETIEPSAGTMTTVEQYRAYGEGFKRAMPDARLNVHSIIVSGDRVAVQGSFTGTHTAPLVSPQGEIPPTGRSIDLPFADFFTLKDGKVVKHQLYYDQIVLLSQLGLMPSPEPV